ncbi:HET-domain-containing protein [Hypoxylon rubiginosum]|uniref:HET-domain-containing protein n=1 Tax=Hypoxylon rubiginosum TaxID=110542 RepID=A0ACB9YNU3_9PEZI|nr:HET-domain-containing protein [Hypoxylon rubiginosum]
MAMTILNATTTHCKALELDDVGLGGVIKHGKDGERLVDFGEVQETYAKRKGTNFASLAITAGLGKLDDGTLESWPKLELKLGYMRDDIFPDLLGLASTSSQGCAFCKILRGDLIAAWDKIREESDRKDDNEEKVHQAKLAITKVTYQLYEVPHNNEGGEVVGSHSKRICLDSLYVFFTIDLGSSKMDYSLHYNIHADAADPCASWFQIWRKPLSNGLISPPSIKRLNELIARSLLEIPTPPGNTYYPTRLLDVGSSTCSKLRLIISAEYPALSKGEANFVGVRYAALSYCWGPKDEANKQLITTRGTIRNHIAQIEFGHLPQTVADAVQVCRTIGIRYLWVDALCIVQDNRDDWAREAFEMANVYANSFITLCILQGNSCTSGFLKKPHSPKTLQVNFRSRLDSSISGKLYLRMLHPPRENLKDSRLQTMGGLVGAGPDEPAKLDLRDAAWSNRGWTFQEARLSPRKLFYGPLMFHISCGKLQESADGSKFDEDDFFRQREPKFSDVLVGWYSLVATYGNRALSYERDRFPALSAFPRTISEKFPDQQYLAGLWKSDLHRGLLWTPYAWTDLKTYLEYPEEGYIAPSWSWACHPGGLTWVRGNALGLYIFSPEFELRGANIVSEAMNPYGRVLSGTLELDAKTFQLPLCRGEGRVIETPDSERRWLGVTFHYTLLSAKDEYIASLHLDWITLGGKNHPEDPLNLDQLCMVLISRSSLDNIYHHWKPSDDKHVTDPEIMLGLLLQPTGEKDEFVKVGLWYSETRGLGGNKFWDNIRRRSVRLV